MQNNLRSSIKEWAIILPISTLWIWTIISLPNLSINSPYNLVTTSLTGLIFLTIVIVFVNMIFGYVGVSGILEDIEQIELEVLIKHLRKINVCILILLFSWIIIILLSLKYTIFWKEFLLLISISIGPAVTLILLLLLNNRINLEKLRE